MLKFKDILYVFSDSTDNSRALAKAVKVAKKNEAKLTVLFTLTDETMPDSLGFSKADIATFIEGKELERDEIIAKYAEDIAIEKDTLLSNAYLDVIEKVQQSGFDLLIKPTENEGLLSRLFGSNDMGYLRQCPCPVWLINHAEEKSDNTVVAAVDVDDNYPVHEREVRAKLNLEIALTAASIALSKGATLKVVSIWSSQYENTLRDFGLLKKSKEEVAEYVNEAEALHRKHFTQFIAAIKAELGQEQFAALAVEQVSIKGAPREELPKYSKSINADLVVMGTVARVGIPGLIIGNTAENILYRLNQSVLVLKPEGFDSLVD
mgnify:CR=1 FL=1